jgi:hypothetical protein
LSEIPYAYSITADGLRIPHLMPVPDQMIVFRIHPVEQRIGVQNPEMVVSVFIYRSYPVTADAQGIS